MDVQVTHERSHGKETIKKTYTMQTLMLLLKTFIVFPIVECQIIFVGFPLNWWAQVVSVRLGNS